MSIELKPCPFCGGEAEIRYHPSCMRDPSCRSWEVGCSICDARVGNTIYAIGKTRDEAIKAWNTRAERTCWKLPSSGGKECTVTHVRSGLSMSFGYWKCSECGCECFEGARYCMGCGAKVVEE